MDTSYTEPISNDESLEIDDPTSLEDTFHHTVNQHYSGHDHADLDKDIGTFWDSLKTDSSENYHTLVETFRYYQTPDVIESLKTKNPTKLDTTQIYHDLEAFSCFLTRIQKHLVDNFWKLDQKEKELVSKIKKRDAMIGHIQNLEKFQNVIGSKEDSERYQQLIKNITDDIQNESLTDDLEEYLKLYHFHKNYVYKLHKIKVLQNKPLCPICFTNNLDTVLIPCGHTLCYECYDKIQSRHENLEDEATTLNCAICRNPIDFEQRIYFS